MNNIIVLGIGVAILLLTFLIISIIISKNKIGDSLTALEIINEDINNSLKQKYNLYKDITNFIKDNLSIKDEAFQDFLNFNAKECKKKELLEILDKTTYEINEYVDNYDELLKNKDFLILKRKLYHVEMNLEAMIEYYNNKLSIYNDLKENGPTSFASKIFDFDEYNEMNIDKKEISRLVNLN